VQKVGEQAVHRRRAFIQTRRAACA
jgi:hypothetical protein